MFSSRSFTVSGITFMSLTHFELYACVCQGVCVVCMCKTDLFLFFAHECLVFQILFIDEIILFPLYIIGTYVEN